MSVRQILKEANYTDEEIDAMITAKTDTGLSWKSIVILAEQKRDNDIFGKIVSRVIENYMFNSIPEVNKFIECINLMPIPDLKELYNE